MPSYTSRQILTEASHLVPSFDRHICPMPFQVAQLNRLLVELELKARNRNPSYRTVWNDYFGPFLVGSQYSPGAGVFTHYEAMVALLKDGVTQVPVLFLTHASRLDEVGPGALAVALGAEGQFVPLGQQEAWTQVDRVRFSNFQYVTPVGPTNLDQPPAGVTGEPLKLPLVTRLAEAFAERLAAMGSEQAAAALPTLRRQAEAAEIAWLESMDQVSMPRVILTVEAF